MDFGLSNTQRELHQKMVALGEQAAVAEPNERLSLLAKEGVLGLSIPLEYGGSGLDLVSTAYAYEGLGKSLRDGGVLLAAGAHLFGVAMMIAKVGSEAQKAHFLPRLASGEVIATVGATEEESGSDVANVRGYAEAADGGYRVFAKKRYVTAAHRAGLFFVVVRNGATGRDLTTLLVHRPNESAAHAFRNPMPSDSIAPPSPPPSSAPDANNIHIGPPLNVMGLRNAGLAPVVMDGAFAPESALLGRRGAGLAVFQIAMTFERALILAFRLGTMESDLAHAIAFVRKRSLGETPIAKHQAVSHRIARMKLRLETARLLTYRAAWTLDQGMRGHAEAALAKWHVAESATQSALDALKLRGGEGFLEGSGLMQNVDDVLGGAIHSGTEDVLPNIVSAWLGL